MIEDLLNKMFVLMSFNPLVSTLSIVGLTALCLWLFRGVIRDYIRKRYDLYTKEEISIALSKANITQEFHDLHPQAEKLRPSLEQSVFNNLKRI